MRFTKTKQAVVVPDTPFSDSDLTYRFALYNEDGTPYSPGSSLQSYPITEDLLAPGVSIPEWASTPQQLQIEVDGGYAQATGVVRIDTSVEGFAADGKTLLTLPVPIRIAPNWYGLWCMTMAQYTGLNNPYKAGTVWYIGGDDEAGTFVTQLQFGATDAHDFNPELVPFIDVYLFGVRWRTGV